MRRRRVRPRKGWFGADHEFRAALGTDLRIGAHFADAHLHTATEALKYRVMPSFDTTAFAIEGDDPGAVGVAESVLLNDSSDVWQQSNINMTFQQYATELVYGRRTYNYVQYSEDIPATIELMSWLAPETIQVRGRGESKFYEQFIRPGLSEGRGSIWFEFGQDEVFELEWPFPWPARPLAPYAGALKIGAEEDRLMDSVSLPIRAQNEPDETFVTFARARRNAYKDSLSRARRVAAQVGDRLFYMAADTPVTRYFEIMRLTRNEEAACELRDYIIGAFNEQVLRRWAERNSWGRLELVFHARLLSAGDWKDIWAGFDDGSLSYDDVVELIRTNQAAARDVDQR